MGAAGSGLSGAAQGFAGLFGLGSFWSPVDDSELQKEQADLQNAQEFWSAKIKQCQANLSTLQLQEVTTELQLATSQQAAINETMLDKIKTNTLMIIMLLFLVTFLIAYDLW
jgi:hypothetical protein